PHYLQINVIPFNRLVGIRAEHPQQLRDDSGLVLRIPPGPCPRLQFEKVTDRRLLQPIEMDIELHAVERDEPALPILGDLTFPNWFEVLPVETRGVGRRRQETRSNEQHGSKGGFA